MSNTPVVFIPALLCDDGLYREVIECLGGEVEARVIIASRPTMAANVADVLKQAPERFVLVGTSFGGSVALEVALAAPERVTALWLMGCSPAAPDAQIRQLVDGMAASPEPVIDMLAGMAVAENAELAAEAFREMAARLGAAIGVEQLKALSTREEVASRLDGIRAPALVLWGEEDRLVSVATGQALADSLPHAHFRSLPGCGHLPTLEDPVACAEIFAVFLENEAGHAH